MEADVNTRIGFISVVMAAISACSTTPVALTPVSKPSNVVWQKVDDARNNLKRSQHDMLQREAEAALAQKNADDAVRRQAALKSLVAASTPNALVAPRVNALTAETEASVNKANADAVTRAEALTTANEAVVSANIALTDAEKQQDQILRPDFESQFAKVISECQQIISPLQRSSRRGAKTAFWLQVSGLVAGAVAAPALVAASSVANKAWIAGLSGYAGSTNLAESSLGNAGLNGVADATAANNLVTKIGTDISAALNKTTYDEKYDALNVVVADCALYQISVPSAPPSIPQQAKTDKP
jgi:hypothetical protein